MTDTPNSPDKPIDRDSGSMTIVVLVLAVALASFAVISETTGKPEAPKTPATTEAPAEPPTTSDTQKQ
jgi:hypothetical protein